MPSHIIKHKSLALLLSLMMALMVFVSSTGGFAEETKKVEETTPKQRRAEALKIMDDFEKLYVFFDVKGIRQSWEGKKKEWKKQIKSIKTDEELVALVQEYIDCLRDGHMHFSKINVNIEPKARNYSGIYFGKMDGDKVCIVNDATGVFHLARSGVEVTKIDKKKAYKWLEEETEKLWEMGGSFSSPQRAGCYVWRWGLLGEPNAQHKITIKVDNKEVTFAAINKYSARMIPETLPKLEGVTKIDEDKDVSYKKLENYGYIYLRGLSKNTNDSIESALKKMGEVKGLIIDLSDNGGGGGYTLDALAPYKDKVVALLSPRCFSAGETFARDLKHKCNAWLMGTTTAGSSSTKEIYTLPRNLGEVVYSTRSRTGIKQQIEFYGIEPDQEVLYNAEDLAKGESTLIKSALEWLNKNVK